MSQRFAIVRTNDAGQEVVINVTGNPGIAKASYMKTVPVGPGVKPGMINGGTVEAADGYGFMPISPTP